MYLAVIPAVWKAEAGRLTSRPQLGLQSEFKASLVLVIQLSGRGSILIAIEINKGHQVEERWCAASHKPQVSMLGKLHL